MPEASKIDCLVCVNDPVLSELYAQAIREHNLSLETVHSSRLLDAVSSFIPRVLVLGHHPEASRQIPKIRKISVPTAIIYIAESANDPINQLSLEGFIHRSQSTINDVVGAVKSLAQINYV